MKEFLHLGYVAVDRVRQTLSRARHSGWKSGWTCFKTYALNGLRRMENTLRSPRVACPCCGWRGYGFRHLDCGNFMVPDVECPACHGHERHRLVHLFLTRRLPGFMRKPGRVLHFAPETQVRRFIDQTPGLQAIGTDIEMHIYPLRPGFTCDIHHLALPDASMDGVFCIHVLEHVKDDRAAIHEIFRVLKPGAQAVIMVPFMMHQIETEEYDAPDPEIFYHVRGYSPLDFKDRLEPFSYVEIMPGDLMEPGEADSIQIPDSQRIYLCTKAG